MTDKSVVIYPNAELLAAATAARLITALVDAQAAHGEASVVLTGGTMGIATLRAVASSPARDAVDWSRLHVWWGDERFLSPGHPDRNETQARAALLDDVPLDPNRVHPMPANEAEVLDDPDAAAERYTADIAGARFDVLLLGVGPDGHVASLFPSNPALEDQRPVVPVRNAPKPPPTRISLSMPTIRSAKEVWLVVAGADKANAVKLALEDDDDVPAARSHGQRQTRWLLDRAAASE
jgi:6-phosphogluconolactonase